MAAMLVIFFILCVSVSSPELWNHGTTDLRNYRILEATPAHNSWLMAHGAWRNAQSLHTLCLSTIKHKFSMLTRQKEQDHPQSGSHLLSRCLVIYQTTAEPKILQHYNITKGVGTTPDDA